VQTGRNIPNNRPDIIIRDNNQTACVLLDAANPGDRNVIKNEIEKILKYKNPITVIQLISNVKANVIPATTGATETISESLRQYLSNVPEKHEIKEMQKSAIFGTAHTLRKVLMSKHKTHYTCDMTLHLEQSVCTEQMQHYAP
jgi:hypothetical protein